MIIKAEIDEGRDLGSKWCSGDYWTTYFFCGIL